MFVQSEAGSAFCTHLVKGMFQECLVQAPPEFDPFSMRGWMVFLLVVQQAASKSVAVKVIV